MYLTKMQRATQFDFNACLKWFWAGNNFCWLWSISGAIFLGNRLFDFCSSGAIIKLPSSMNFGKKNLWGALGLNAPVFLTFPILSKLDSFYYKQEAQSHCDIFRQGCAKMVNWSYNNWFQKKKHFWEKKVANGYLDGRIGATIRNKTWDSSV